MRTGGGIRFVPAVLALLLVAMPGGADPSSPGSTAATLDQMAARYPVPVTIATQGRDGRAVRPSRRTLPEIVADQGSAWVSPQSRGEASRAALEGVIGKRVPSTIAESGVTIVGQWGYGTADLDGDGVGDLLVLSATQTGEGTQLSVSARRGVNGAELWARNVPGSWFYVMELGDVNGDARDDLLFVEFLNGEETSDSSCVASLCTTTYRATFQTILRMVSGSDGAQVWLRAIPGECRGVEEYFEASTSSAGASRYRSSLTITNAYIQAFASGDHDGDGIEDVVLNAIGMSYEGTYDNAHADPAAGGTTLAAGSLFDFSYGGRWDTAATVVKGSSGERFFSRDGTGAIIPPVLVPAGNATGDETQDLLWMWAPAEQDSMDCRGYSLSAPGVNQYDSACEPEYPTLTQHLEMIDGHTLESAWNVTGDERYWAYGYPAFGDSTGDGKDDVILAEFDQRVCKRSLISGATGDLVWSREACGDFALAGEIGGSAGDDFLMVEISLQEGIWRAWRVTIERIDGTGSTLSESTHLYSAAPGVSVLSCFCGDADGDGAVDVLVQQFTSDAEGTSVAIHTKVVSAITDAELFNRYDTGETWIVPAGDTDGDGAGDFYRVAEQDFEAASSVTFDSLRGPAGSVAWTRTFTMYPGDTFGYSTSPDFLGSGGSDLVLTRSQFYEGVEASRLDVLDGRTGDTAWGIGDTLQEPQ